jgi:ankyrin repeat protein
LSAIDELVEEREEQEPEGITPLHLAAEDGHEAVVGYLLENGRDPNAKTKNKVSKVMAEEFTKKILHSAYLHLLPLYRTYLS